MKEVLRNLAYFCVLAGVFSGFSGCGDSSVVDVQKPAENVAATPNGPETKKRTSEYPPLSSKLATAEIELIDGTVTTAEERKGKVLLLNLWGIWCQPCRVEMPHLVAMQEKYRDKGFEVIGLNIGDDDMMPEDIERIKKFAEELKLNYELARIDNSVTEEFARETKFAGVPLSILVDREGNLRGVFGGAGPSSIRKMQETVEKVVSES